MSVCWSTDFGGTSSGVTLSTLPFLTVLNLRIGVAPASGEKEAEETLRINVLGAQNPTNLTHIEGDSLWMSIHTAGTQALKEVNLYAVCITLLMSVMQWAAVSAILWIARRVCACFRHVFGARKRITGWWMDCSRLRGLYFKGHDAQLFRDLTLRHASASERIRGLLSKYSEGTRRADKALKLDMLSEIVERVTGDTGVPTTDSMIPHGVAAKL